MTVRLSDGLLVGGKNTRTCPFVRDAILRTMGAASGILEEKESSAC
jgi:hypothetical protein